MMTGAEKMDDNWTAPDRARLDPNVPEHAGDSWDVITVILRNMPGGLALRQSDVGI